ncbi:hypothetical protein [Lewinella sp. W8]|uniref:hypothetical protein n=1 Tax=Lewinella sp. W8 TaxID=2528208 RepID=UPI00106771C3|nr:hypothetical protein [Lewinella sp. W8]MTB50734.1 hypothetical protein [Lewinella sp. W8]
MKKSLLVLEKDSLLRLAQAQQSALPDQESGRLSADAKDPLTPPGFGGGGRGSGLGSFSCCRRSCG